MDLGATICKPQNPLCLNCPWAEECIARKQGIQNEIPNIKKPLKRKARGAIFLAFDKKGALFLTKREKGLLSGLFEFPWNIDGFDIPFDADWVKTDKTVHHVFTHIDYTADIYVAHNVEQNGLFVRPNDLKAYALSTLMKKVIKKAL